jgi:uncharacterized protein (TIGR02246 family)
MEQPQDARMANEDNIRALYQQLLGNWNRRDADAMADLFAEDGDSIGFDGSLMSGRAEIAASLRQIFTDHLTGTYVDKVRAVRWLSADAAVLRAVVGMVPPAQSDLAPQLNAIQTLVVTKHAGRWEITQLQNTPAQYHGRPELVQQLTDELRMLL